MEDEKHRTILKVQAKVKTSLIRAFVLIFALIPYLYATASDFEVDGLYYNILSEEDRTVEVTHKSNQCGNRIYNQCTVIFLCSDWNSLQHTLRHILCAYQKTDK